MSEKTGRTAPGPPGPGGLPRDTAGQRARRRRRPTGEPPPLPHPIAISTTAWLLLVVVIVAGAFLISERTPWLRLGDRANTWFLRLLADVRTPWLTNIATAIKVAGTGWAVTVLGLSVVALTMIFRRWRHLLVFVGSFFFLLIVGRADLLRPVAASPVRHNHHRRLGRVLGAVSPGRHADHRPHGCRVLPGRAGPPPHLRQDRGCRGHAAFGLARVYLAVDHPDDVLFGAALGVAIPVAAFRWFTPNEVFPVVYRRGKTAHVDVTGRRGQAIRTAVHDQLGLTVLEIKPVGLESSAGSTPLRLRVEGAPTSTCSRSCTPRATYGPTAGTRSGGPSFTAPWKMRYPSRRCAR